MNPSLEIEALHVAFGRRSVLWDLSFQIPQGVLVAVLGPNGAGKSTLLKAVMGLIPRLSGKISILGKSLEEMRSQIAYVPQRETIDWDFPITAFEVALMGRFGKLGPFGRIRKADREAATHALERVGMSAFASRQISELSGGQQQRLFLARAFVQNPSVYFLDEPLKGVDLATEKVIMDLLKKERDQGKTVFVVHHDLPSVTEYFDWAILLNHRLIGVGPTREVFTKEMIGTAFGKGNALFEEAVSLFAKAQVGE